MEQRWTKLLAELEMESWLPALGVPVLPVVEKGGRNGVLFVQPLLQCWVNCGNVEIP
jgi:hypothetical protein